MTTITPGRWAWWMMDEPMPDTLKVYEGTWGAATCVGEITRYQAMAYYRHWNNGGVYHNVKRHGRWIDIRMVGDVEAAFDDDE